MTFTITFQWWIVPILTLAIGFVISIVIANRSSGGLFDWNGLLSFMIAVGSVIAAIFMVIGHYL